MWCRLCNGTHCMTKWLPYISSFTPPHKLIMEDDVDLVPKWPPQSPTLQCIGPLCHDATGKVLWSETPKWFLHNKNTLLSIHLLTVCAYLYPKYPPPPPQCLPSPTHRRPGCVPARYCWSRDKMAALPLPPLWCISQLKILPDGRYL